MVVTVVVQQQLIFSLNGVKRLEPPWVEVVEMLVLPQNKVY